MNVYTFHRESGGFYPIELETDAQALADVERNPGTVKVVNEITKEVVFEMGKKTTVPPLPSGMTRFECIEGLKELRKDAMELAVQKEPAFLRWPDVDLLLDYIEQHGFPAPEAK